MTQLTRRELLRRAGAVAIGGAALAAAPSVLPRASARVADGARKEKGRALRDLADQACFVCKHERENDTTGGAAAGCKAAYDHVRHVFEGVGATNLRYVATLMRGTYQGARGGPAAWVP